jgi:predicted nucleotidyltransferase
MPVSEAHRRHWQQRLQAEAAAVEQRRQQAEGQASAAARALRARWPQIEAIWLFGSVLEPGFGLQSDIDLCVEGLPAADLLEAMALLDDLEPGGLPLDLVRFEALPAHWQQRLRERARLLL